MTINSGLISVYGDSAGWYAEYFEGGRLYLVDSETEFLTIYRAAADGRTEYGAGDMIADYAPDEVPDELTDIYKALWAGIAPHLTTETWASNTMMLNRLNAILGGEYVALDGDSIDVLPGHECGYTIACENAGDAYSVLFGMIDGINLMRYIDSENR